VIRGNGGPEHEGVGRRVHLGHGDGRRCGRQGRQADPAWHA
jgi:hypothetical protein